MIEGKSALTKPVTETKPMEEQKPIAEPKLFKLKAFYDAIPDAQIEFEWPKKEDLMKMKDCNDVKLKSIDVWYLDDNNFFPIQKVKVILSNGESSPWFQAQTSNKAIADAKLDFDLDTKYSKCEGASDGDGIFELRFMDNEGTEKLKWNRWADGKNYRKGA